MVNTDEQRNEICEAVLSTNMVDNVDIYALCNQIRNRVREQERCLNLTQIDRLRCLDAL